jgi:hypothetical protein
MTSSVPLGLPVFKVMDPNLDIAPPSERKYYATFGGSDVQYQNYTAQGSTTAQVVFSNIRPPSGVCVDRRVRWNCKWLVDFTNLDDADKPTQVDIMNSQEWGLRAYPNTNCVDTAQVKLNTQSITSIISQYQKYLMRFGSNPDERNRYMSGSPSFLDDVSNYTNSGGSGYFAGARQPFAAYATNIEEISRQVGIFVTQLVQGPVIAGTQRVNSFVMELEEPLFINPFNWTDKQVPGFFHLTSIDITLILNNALSKRLFCGGISNVGAYNGVPAAIENPKTKITFSEPPTLLVRYIQPQAEQNIEPVYIYPYYLSDDQIDKSGLLLPIFNGYANPATWPGNQPVKSNVVSNVYTWSNVPSRIYIYARPNQNAIDTLGYGYKIPDICARIFDFNGKWNSRSGLLSTATEKDLYDISVKRGADQSWSEWKKYNGSILCIDPALDLGLHPLEVSGMSESINFSFTMNIANLISLTTDNMPFDPPNILLPSVINYEVHVVPIYEGVLTMKEQWASIVLGILEPSDLVYGNPNLHGTPHGTYNELYYDNKGGAWYDTLWRGIKKALPIVGKVAKAVSGVVSGISGVIPGPQAQAVHQVANAVNQGLAAIGAGRGRKMRGGAVMTCSTLENRLN